MGQGGILRGDNVTLVIPDGNSIKKEENSSDTSVSTTSFTNPFVANRVKSIDRVNLEFLNFNVITLVFGTQPSNTIILKGFEFSLPNKVKQLIGLF